MLTELLGAHDLPAEPPRDPMPLLLEWWEDARARGGYADFNAMTLATATPDGFPSARIVLCKAIETTPPALVFYTNYESRKGRELDANPRAAALFHWPHAKRQARVEGAVRRVSDAESDAYFRTRPLLSRIGACVSRQSEPLESSQALVAAAMRRARTAMLEGDIPRPAHWGGFRVHIESVELWSAREGRLHDRVRWTRLSDDETPTWRAVHLSA
ncbi:MAG: pyridoxamine 5'-phosphate oxidase [Phycisphaerales bacterium]|nr:MAG: pyridoxamine 5'-phosphate oxidase [Phycisphaerales bacterium]